MICGVILAGGRSLRFGREKAAVEVGGRPMLAHVAARLGPQIDALAINAREDSWAARFAGDAGLPLLPDAPGDPDGPLSGIKAGLVWAAAAGADLLATAPCDTPLLPSDLIGKLTRALRAGAGAGVATVRTADGLQPLCAIWRCDRLDQVCAALAQGRHPPVHEMLAQLVVIEVAFEDASAFENINTPEDQVRAAAGCWDLSSDLPHSQNE